MVTTMLKIAYTKMPRKIFTERLLLVCVVKIDDIKHRKYTLWHRLVMQTHTQREKETEKLLRKVG